MEERGKRAGQTSLAPQLYVKEITPSEVRGMYVSTSNFFVINDMCQYSEKDDALMMNFYTK